eukprot:6207019-Pyramimonas_sp.AAC.1
MYTLTAPSWTEHIKPSEGQAGVLLPWTGQAGKLSRPTARCRSPNKIRIYSPLNSGQYAWPSRAQWRQCASTRT